MDAASRTWRAVSAVGLEISKTGIPASDVPEGGIVGSLIRAREWIAKKAYSGRRLWVFEY